MVTVPVATPVAIPVEPPIDANKGLPLVQLPPVMASLKEVVLPTHTDAIPEIGESGLTVMIVDALQLPGVV